MLKGKVCPKYGDFSRLRAFFALWARRNACI